jgi:hypothetical protein
MENPAGSASEAHDLIEPPHLRTSNGRKRLIGVEIEFANLDSRQAAQLVRKRFKGQVQEQDPHRFAVLGTEFGDFTVELDWRYVHGSKSSKEGGEPNRDRLPEKTVTDTLEREFYTTIGDIGRLWVPVEIVAPPVPISRLPELDVIVQDLRTAGAQGTDEGLLFAFATQLNPEVPSLEHESILAHLQAFLLLSDWLRKEIDLDVKRRLLPFIDPFPRSYVEKVVDPEYRPSREQLIDDYLEANPTRNRELDLLPLFSELDPDRVRARIDDPLIKSRPTFHYRLPDTRLRDPGWGLVTEWNRWVRVERLAADRDRLRAASEEYLARSTGWLPQEWIDAIGRWFR